ncbi:chorismate-binding protein [Nocardiopsis mangrovi]|uniref:aminodeoxychorismate synthase n=1 Tax=Nocardiopsis mangrovi TaxID=1179818 RepID=A0ABV9E2E4_9ACTN
MRVLLIDNHDSYTHNLAQLIAVVLGAEPEVAANDAPALERAAATGLTGFDAVVVSPGPGRPQHPRDLGAVPRVLADTALPVLGVCLGHQAIAHLAGAAVHAAPVPRHGHLSRVRHTGAGLFAGVPQGFTAVRYHSLAVPEPLPEALEATAWAEDGVLMGLAHRTLPRWGVQFHPESVASEHGARVIANFGDLARQARDGGAGAPEIGTGRRPGRASATGAEPGPRPVPRSGVGRNSRPPETEAQRSALRASETRAERHPRRASETPGCTPDPSGIGSDLRRRDPVVSETPGGAPRPDPGELRFATLPYAVDTEGAFVRLYGDRTHAFWLDSSRTGPTARFSFLGDAQGSRGEVLTYRAGEGSVAVSAQGRTGWREAGTVFDALRRRTAPRPGPAPAGLPFDFAGGYVGYFGYELKADLGAAGRHRSPLADAVWLRCDRFVAVDHAAGRTYAVAADGGADGDAWIAATVRALAALPAPPPAGEPGGADPAPLLERSREGYEADVKECLGRLIEGESYEVCLTTRLRLPAPEDDVAYYRRLRRAAPAPYAALLRLGETAVFSASPERFLRVGGDGTAESRPIKGTAPRHADPVADARLAAGLRADPKTRAENLMIVDLVRNDLGRVCEPGAVGVPGFMFTESHAAVHQLVSTVRGRLRAGVHAVDAVGACFPPGSMTGAPKERTMEIIDGLEVSARGVYSGALGYLSYGGAADLSVVIRTAVRSGDVLTVGAGGAVVLDSDPGEEYREMLLKAAVPLGGLPSPATG